MSRYMVKVSYSVAGLQGIMKEGAEHRRAFIAKMVAGMGGSLQSFDFGFGETDVYAICEMPDDESAAAVAMAVGASGAGSCQTVKLLTAAQVDRARGIQTGYQAPG